MDEEENVLSIIGALQGARGGNTQVNPYNVIAKELLREQQNNDSLLTGQLLRRPQINTGDPTANFFTQLAQGIAGSYFDREGQDEIRETFEPEARAFLNNPYQYKGKNLNLEAASRGMALQEMAERAKMQAQNALKERLANQAFERDLQKMYIQDELKSGEEERRFKRENPYLQRNYGENLNQEGGSLDPLEMKLSRIPESIREGLRRDLESGLIKNDKDLFDITKDRLSQSDALRKELTSSEEYKTLLEVAPKYTDMMDNLFNKDKVSDLNFIYGYAKLMDPDSVVRDSEQGMVISSSNPLYQQLFSKVSSEINGQGRLSPQTRLELLRAASPVVSGFKKGYDRKRSDYEGFAKERGILEKALGDRIDFELPNLKELESIVGDPNNYKYFEDQVGGGVPLMEQIKNFKAPKVGGDFDSQIKSAKEAGYSDEEIRAYLESLKN